jgi:hypothetical protein
MKKITSLGIMFIIFALALLSAPNAVAQTPTDPPAGPIPAPLFTAQKVFISNAESTNPLEVPYLAYNAFYAGMKAWGKYELVDSPADADLVLAVRFEGLPSPQLRLVISDAKTGVELWPLLEMVKGWSRQATGRKNFATAMAALVFDVKVLTTPPPPDADANPPTN